MLRRPGTTVHVAGVFILLFLSLSPGLSHSPYSFRALIIRRTGRRPPTPGPATVEGRSCSLAAIQTSSPRLSLYLHGPGSCTTSVLTSHHHHHHHPVIITTVFFVVSFKTIIKKPALVVLAARVCVVRIVAVSIFSLFYMAFLVYRKREEKKTQQAHLSFVYTISATGSFYISLAIHFSLVFSKSKSTFTGAF